jgi:hypothetical protein
MPPSLSRDATSAHAAAGAFVGEMRFTGCVIATERPRGEIERLLPAGVGLACKAAAATHPLVFIFGQQSEGTILFGGMSYPLGVRYTEFGVAIPSVTYRGGGALHTYVPRMYSSYFPPVRDGNVHYGFTKAQAVIDWHGPIATLTTPDGVLLCHATVEALGAWRRHAAARDALAWVEAMVALPILGRRANGRFVRSRFRFGFSDSLIRPVRCAMAIEVPLIEGCAAERLYSAADAAVEMQGMLWQLSWPEPLPSI